MEGLHIVTSWLLLLLLLVATTTPARATRPLVFSKNCPKEHPITIDLQKPDGTVLKVELSHSDKRCEDLISDITEQQSCEDCRKVERLKKKSPKEGYDFIEDLPHPVMTPVVTHGNQYLAQIELLLPTNTAGMFPRRMYLEMVAYKRNVTVVGPSYQYEDIAIDTKCVFLNITNSTGHPDWTPLRFTFTCLELVQTHPDEFLLVTMQLWSLPYPRSSSRRCRNTRAVGPGPRRCGVRCSIPSPFTLMLAGENEFQMCACADTSRINTTVWQRGDNQQTVVNVEGLPPLIGNVTAYIVNSAGKVAYEKVFTGNESQYNVTESLLPGNYSLMLDAECPFSRLTLSLEEMRKSRDMIRDQCHGESGIHTIDFFKIEDTREEPGNSSPLMATVGGVLAVVLVVVIGTIVVFFTLHRRRKHIGSPSGMPGSNNHTQIPCPIYHCTPRYIYRRSMSEEEKLLQDVPIETETQFDRLLQQTEQTDEAKLLLYHPDNEQHTTRVKRLITASHENRVKMKSFDSTESFTNWRDLAESATTVYKDIVIVVSDKLLQLLELYKQTGIEGEAFQALVNERRQEYSPCVVMENVRRCVHEKRTDFKLHVVTLCDSVETGQQLAVKFFKQHEYLKGTNIVIMYNLNFADGSED